MGIELEGRKEEPNAKKTLGFTQSTIMKSTKLENAR